MKRFDTFPVIVILLGIGILLFDSYGRESMVLNHIKTARKIQETCKKTDLIGIARDGHTVAIYQCKD